MKACPLKIVPGSGYQICPLDEATHVGLRFPGPSGDMQLPMILRGSRDDVDKVVWSWNGDLDNPTIKPSIKSWIWIGANCCYDDGKPAREVICHTWVNDGVAVFHDDTTHDLRGQTVEMLEIDPTYYER